MVSITRLVVAYEKREGSSFGNLKVDFTFVIEPGEYADSFLVYLDGFRLWGGGEPGNPVGAGTYSDVAYPMLSSPLGFSPLGHVVRMEVINAGVVQASRETRFFVPVELLVAGALAAGVLGGIGIFAYILKKRKKAS